MLVGYLRLAVGYRVGVHRWTVRAVAYAIVLVTDAYPFPVTAGVGRSGNGDVWRPACAARVSDGRARLET